MRPHHHLSAVIRAFAVAAVVGFGGCGPSVSELREARGEPAPAYTAVRVYNGSGTDVEMNCRQGMMVYPLGRVRAGATEVFTLPVRGCVPFGADGGPHGYGTSSGIRVQAIREPS